MRGRLGVTILLHPPDYRDRDIDNLVKPMLDALEKAGVYENDSQVDAIAVVRGSVGRNYSDSSKGCCEVTICRAAAMFQPERTA
jgi:Holliday junction resolvase RusA-like endonuclease